MFDLEKDPHETSNVAAEQPEVVAKLAQRIADSLLELNRVERVVVRVRKPEVRFTGDENEGYEVEINRP